MNLIQSNILVNIPQMSLIGLIRRGLNLRQDENFITVKVRVTPDSWFWKGE
jgi:hypothetical protein